MKIQVRLKKIRLFLRNLSLFETDGYWDFLDSHATVKYQTGLARKRAIVMLPPKVLEKKNQRILEKGAL